MYIVEYTLHCIQKQASLSQEQIVSSVNTTVVTITIETTQLQNCTMR